MLHFETVESSTLAILKKLMSLPQLASFSLVGGTALSLIYGHRISVDLDLFSFEKFDRNGIIKTLEIEFRNEFVYEGDFSSFGVFGFIKDVKIDLIRYPHPIVFSVATIENIRICSTQEIAAMKIQAILGRGKKKDFWDMAELLSNYSLEEIISFNQLKYPSQQLLISIPQALLYFEDANESEDPISLKGQTWGLVKNIIQEKVNEYLK